MQLKYVITFTTLFIALISGSIHLNQKDYFKSNADYTIGDKIDSLNGVYVYYNGKMSNVEGRNLAPDGYNLGLKYQCVEFVKRYYYEHYNHKMPDSYGNAKDFFQKNLKDGSRNQARNLTQFTNGSAQKPQIGDLIVMDAHISNQYGHVAIISRVDNNEVEIIQQNGVPSNVTRERYPLTYKNNKWTIKQSTILGWLRMP